MNVKKANILSAKHLEMELLDLGNEINRMNKVFKENSFDESFLSHFKRCQWLNKIIDELNALGRKVDETTRTIMKMLYIDSKTHEEISIKIRKSSNYVKKINTLIVNVIAEEMGMIDLGESVLKETSRYLTAETKKKVNEIYNGKCAFCRSDKNTHFHHVLYFSEGGSNEYDNLMLLCPSCHAKEHEGERAYNVLKSVSERAM